MSFNDRQMSSASASKPPTSIPCFFIIARISAILSLPVGKLPIPDIPEEDIDLEPCFGGFKHVFITMVVFQGSSEAGWLGRNADKVEYSFVSNG